VTFNIDGIDLFLKAFISVEVDEVDEKGVIQVYQLQLHTYVLVNSPKIVNSIHIFAIFAVVNVSIY
jgi:hypothetical protein